MSSHKLEYGSESDALPAKAPTGDSDMKRVDLVRQLKGIFDKVPPESLYDMLANGVLSGRGDISLDALEAIVSISKEEAEVYLENPPPPSLSPFELKGEVSVLFEELYRLSAEAAHAKEPKWEEWTFVLEQIADSLTKWLRNIWLCVWEYQMSFEKAHECLMIAQGFLETLTAPKLGCVCPFTTLPLIVEFRDLSGDVVRTWQNLTGTVLQEVTFWVWRELFMSMLITKRPQYKTLIQKMIRNIEGSYGASHHIILFGGSPDGFGIDGYYNDAGIMDLEDSELEDSDDGFADMITEFCPDHWGDMFEEFEELKDILLEGARTFFAAHPTLHGYLTLCSLEPIKGDLHAVLLENAPFSRAAALCALTVFHHSHSLELLQTILETCNHLFEAHDTPSLRLAVECLLRHPETMGFALSFIQQQLQDSLEAIKIAFHDTFKLDRVVFAMESLSEISSLTLRSTNRTEKVKAWVKDILMPNSVAADPFSLAAMVFGFPPPGTEEIIEDEDAAAAHFLDTSHAAEFDGLLDALTVTTSRPHLRDLCELNRCHLVKRLVTLLSLVDDLPQIARPARYKTLLTFERAVFKELPWMRFPDVVAEFKAKYTRRPHEGHLKTAIECLQTFLEKQKAHHTRVRIARQKAAEVAKPQATPSPAAMMSPMDDVD